MTDLAEYVVCGRRPWNRPVFDELLAGQPGEWRFAGSPAELDELLGSMSPRYIFFVHWSWRVPTSILETSECVCFHMTDVPYGRGGSPLQNLILRGHTATKLTALRMVEEMDAGPVYVKEDLSLEGSAEEIFVRSARLAAGMIQRIVREQPEPRAQVGEPVVFQRRTPEQSAVPDGCNLEELYDFIRMLDADGYPRAFVERGGLRYVFSDAALEGDRLVAAVSVVRVREDQRES